MKLTTTTVIDGHPVDFLFKMSGDSGYHVYQREEDYGSRVTLFFVDGKEEVVDLIGIEADMGQGCGYISSIEHVQTKGEN